jgi:chromosomal replication initiator protein
MTPLQITDEAIHGYVQARCHEMQLGPQAVKGPCRSRELVRARAILATELRRAPWELSLPAIGRALGGRDHTSILWALRGGRHKS